jgi:hypothetical protein
MYTTWTTNIVLTASFRPSVCLHTLRTAGQIWIKLGANVVPLEVTSNFARFNFLRSVIKTWWMREIVRWECKRRHSVKGPKLRAATELRKNIKIFWVFFLCVNRSNNDVTAVRNVDFLCYNVEN